MTILIPCDESMVLNEIDSIDSNVSTMNFAHQILHIMQTIAKMWQSLTPSDVHIDQITAGTSNGMYCVTRKIFSDEINSEPSRIIVRIYKPSFMIDREREKLIACTLDSANLIPKWYCIFGNGRIEEYIESTSVPANIFRLQKTACIVASRLARIHALLPYVLGDKNEVFEPDRDYMLSKIEQMSNAAETASLELLNKYESMLKDCHHHGRDQVTQRNYIQCRLEMLQKIMSVNRRKSKDFEHAILQAQASQSPLMLAHCDIHHANLLEVSCPVDTVTVSNQSNAFSEPTTSDMTGTTDMNSITCTSTSITISSDDIGNGSTDISSLVEEGSTTPSDASTNESNDFLIIDFEYAMQTTRGYDLANFCCEFCSDYESPLTPPHRMDFNLFPDKDRRCQIIQAYLNSYNTSCNQLQSESNDMLYDKSHSHSRVVVTDEDVERLDAEIMSHVPLVHLHWACWGVIKANSLPEDKLKHSSADLSQGHSFDYLKYSLMRYEEWNAFYKA